MIFIKLTDDDKGLIKSAEPDLALAYIQNFIEESRIIKGQRELDTPTTEFLFDYLFRQISNPEFSEGISAILKIIDPHGARMENYKSMNEENLKTQRRYMEDKSVFLLNNFLRQNLPARQPGEAVNRDSNTGAPDLKLYSQSKSGYTATHNGVSLEFGEQIVFGDGDCAFIATGFSRDLLFDTLIGLKNDESIRKHFYLEMRSFYIIQCNQLAGRSSLDYCTSNEEPLISLYAKKMLCDDKMSEASRAVLAKNPALEMQGLNLRQNFDKFPDSVDKTNWLLNKDQIDKIEYEIAKIIMSPDCFEKYLHENKKKNQPITVAALVEYARSKKNVNLCVWKKQNPQGSSLCIESAAGDVLANDTIHLLFDQNHFNRLHRKNDLSNPAQECGQSSSSSGLSYSVRD